MFQAGLIASRTSSAARAGCALLTLLLALGACGSGPSAHAASTLVDDFGDTLTAGVSRPARIVSLNPTTTELLYAIGAGGRLVGRTTYDVWPAEVRRVPDLGPGLRPNVEAVLAARPDLVFLYASEDNRDAARRLRAAGVRTVSYRVDRLADFRRVTIALGALTGDTMAARHTVDSVDATLRRVRAATAREAHPTVFWPLWESPLLTVGGGSFLNELIEIAGGRNIYAELAQPSPAIAMEDLIRRDPDVIITSLAMRARMLAEPRWQTLRAVRAGRILVVDSTIVNGPSARIGASAVAIAAQLHAPPSR